MTNYPNIKSFLIFYSYSLIYIIKRYIYVMSPKVRHIKLKLNLKKVCSLHASELNPFFCINFSLL